MDMAMMAATTTMIKTKAMVVAAAVATRCWRRQRGIMTDAARVVDLDLHSIL
jgi:hypothetical protein